VLAEDGLDLARVKTPFAAAQPRRDPAGLGRELGLVEVLLASGAVEEDHGDEAAAGDEADEQQPPLELGHQRWPGV
jgi:hypothetical protein